MKCLSCHHPLVNVQESHFFRHLTYDVCNTCGGMWLDRGELDKIALQTPGSVEQSSLYEMREEEDKKSLPRTLSVRCLRCPNQMMIKMHFMGESRILLDTCENCGGLWVDGGELTKINQIIKKFDKKAKPSNFGRFLQHAHSSFFHRIDVVAPFECQESEKRK